MTNSMLTTLSNSALKFSLEDKHVGYVLYSGRALSSVRPTHHKVQTSPAWLLFYIVTPFRRRVKLPRVLAVKSVQCPVCRCPGPIN